MDIVSKRESIHVKVIDFNLAELVNDDYVSNDKSGTFVYSAPEVLKGEK